MKRARAATVMALLAVVGVAGCGGSRAGAATGAATARQKLPAPPRTATLAAINGFVNRAEGALHRRYAATYRISLFRYHGRVFRGRVAVYNWPRGERLVFLGRAPRTGFYEVPDHATELLQPPSGQVSCQQDRPQSAWQCVSEAGEGMGPGIEYDEMAPRTFTIGLGAAANQLTSGSTAPYPLFLSRRTVDGRPVRCLSIGNARGAVGRVCTTNSGMIVSYRVQRQFSGNDYATAELVRYSARLPRGMMRPPAKVFHPGD